jgi:hypothetical protein
MVSLSGHVSDLYQFARHHKINLHYKVTDKYCSGNCPPSCGLINMWILNIWKLSSIISCYITNKSKRFDMFYISDETTS